jgi:hypothetical protein
MFRPIRMDHTKCLQVAIKTHSFTPPSTVGYKKLSYQHLIDTKDSLLISYQQGFFLIVDNSFLSIARPKRLTFCVRKYIVSENEY